MKKLFVALLICFGPVTSNADVSCQTLFGKSDLYRSIHALAELRLELDLAQTSNEDSIAISLLKVKYDEKEKAIIKYLSRQDLLRLMKLEIGNLQREMQKSDQIRAQKVREFDATYGALAIFHPFKTEGPNPKYYSVMATPTTEIIWSKVAQLINSKLDSGYHVVFDPSIYNDYFRFHPERNNSYLQIEKWIRGLNQLSDIGALELQNIFPQHQKGDFYKLPLLEEWQTFLKSVESQSFTKEDLDIRQVNDIEAVAERRPFTIQSHDYYVLKGKHWQADHVIHDFPMHGVVGVARIETEYDDNGNPVGLESGVIHHSKSMKLQRVTFRLFRERAQP